VGARFSPQPSPGAMLHEGVALTELYLTVYRLNTFPFIHMGFLHMIVNLIALTPLMERFEAEHGTLNTTALFMGRELRRH
jgi:membrane associated rhomboid family serine protease